MAKEDITLSLGIQFGAEHFKKAYDKSFKDMQRDAKRATRGSDSAFTKFTTKVRHNFTKMPAIIKKANKAIAQYNKEAVEGQKLADDATKTYIEQFKVVQDLHAEMATMSKEEQTANKARLADQVKTLQGYKDQLRAAEDYYDRAVKGAEDLQDEIADMELEFSGTKMIEAAEEAGKELAEPFSALLSKDIPGAAKSFSKLAGKGFGATFKGLGGLVSKGGEKLAAKGAKMEAGGGGGAMASAMKSIGGLVGKMGPMLQTLAKIGPLMGTVSMAVVGLVKLFLDAEAGVKDWNKELLQAGGMNQYFSSSLNAADHAVEDSTKTMDQFRNAAYGTATDFKAAWDNITWGISADTHKEVLANLQAEGVKLTTLSSDYGQLTKQSSAYTNSVAAITQAAVAWSRNMGVSLQEVTGFQAEMMTELGLSLGSTTESFRMMSRASADSGIASNKFFAMIRGVSADLSLYNTRMEDAVKLLGKLGKVMSPRNAQKFMQWSMKAVAGMGRIQKLQTTLLAGPGKVGKMVAADIADKSKSIAKEIAAATNGDADKIAGLLASGKAEDKKTVKDMIAGIKDQSKKGSLTEAVGMLGIQKKRAKKGTYGVAMAAGQMSPVRQAAMLTDAIKRFGDIGDIGAEQMAENLGVSTEQLEQMELFKDSMDDQRDLLVEQAKKAGGQLMINGKMMKTSEIQALSMDQVYDTLSDQEKADLEAKSKEEQANKKMGTNVTSILDKLQVLIDWFMNTFYNVMMDIYTSILDIWDSLSLGDAAKQKKTKAEDERKIGHSELASKAYKEAGGDKYAMAGKLLQGKDSYGERFMTGMAKSQDEYFKLAKAKETAKTDEEKKAIQGRMDELAKIKAEKINKVTSATTMDESKKALTFIDQGPFKDVAANMKKSLDEGKEWGPAMTDAMKGLTTEQQSQFQTELAGKQMWAMDPAKLAQLTADMPHPEDIGTAIFDQFPDLNKFAEKGTKEGSIYTHDTTMEGALNAGLDVWVQNWPTSIADAQSDPAAPVGIGASPLGPDADVSEEQMEQAEATVGTLAEIENVLKNKGIKLNKSWMDNHMKKMIEEATLDALRTAMPEFIMLQGAGPEEVAKAIGRGVDPKEIGTKLVQAAKDAKGGDEGNPLEVIKGLGGQNAAGGFVSGINKEGIALVAKGEQIVPAGGGAGGAVKVELSLKGDLAALIEAKAQETIVKHEAASKFR